MTRERRAETFIFAICGMDAGSFALVGDSLSSSWFGKLLDLLHTHIPVCIFLYIPSHIQQQVTCRNRSERLSEVSKVSKLFDGI